MPNVDRAARAVVGFVGLIAAACGGGSEGPGIVNAPVVISVTVTPATVPALGVGSTVTLTADVQVQNGASTAVTWSSSAPNVATVGSNGVVTGVAPGDVTITATSVFNSTKTGSASITVKGTVRITSVTPSPVSLRIGTQAKLTSSVEADPGLSTAVTYQTQSAAIATVSADGTITGVSGGQTGVIVTAVADATQRVTVPVTVVDQCQYGAPLTIGGTTTGTVTDASCNKLAELYRYTVNAQTSLTLSATVQFPGSFGFIGDRTGFFSSGGLSTGQSITYRAIVAPGSYNAFVQASGTASRGAFSVTTSSSTSFASLCGGVVATTGVTVTLPLNACGFQPTTRPPGTYNSFSIGILPFVRPDERITITVTASGFTPLIQAHVGAFPPITAVAPTGSNTAVQSFVGPAGGTYATFFYVSSVDAGQTGTFSVKIEGPPSLPAIVGATEAWRPR